MGKSFKERPGKYKFNKDFQKKQKKQNNDNNDSKPSYDPYESMPTKEQDAWSDVG